jgi:hypothetical protein
MSRGGPDFNTPRHWPRLTSPHPPKLAAGSPGVKDKALAEIGGIVSFYGNKRIMARTGIGEKTVASASAVGISRFRMRAFSLMRACSPSSCRSSAKGAFRQTAMRRCARLILLSVGAAGEAQRPRQTTRRKDDRNLDSDDGKSHGAYAQFATGGADCCANWMVLDPDFSSLAGRRSRLESPLA